MKNVGESCRGYIEQVGGDGMTGGRLGIEKVGQKYQRLVYPTRPVQFLRDLLNLLQKPPNLDW